MTGIIIVAATIKRAVRIMMSWFRTISKNNIQEKSLLPSNMFQENE